MANGEKTKKTAVIYARFSCDKQREASIDDQVRVCTEYAQRSGYEVDRVYSDYAISGRTDERPQFQQMVRDAGSYDAVIVYMMDRFSRDAFDASIYKKELSLHGVRVLSAMENIPDSPEGVIYEKLLEGMAACESIKNSQRTRNAMRGQALKCLYNGVHVYGYGVDPETGRYVVDEREAAVVREVFERYARREPLTSMVRDLNLRGVRSTTGKPVSYGFLRNMVNCEKYRGVYIWADVRFEGGMPAIVSDELWEAARRSVPVKRRKQEVWDDFPLVGMLECARCGHDMVGYSCRNHQNKKYAYYGCQRKAHCDRKHVAKEALERAVASAVRCALSSDGQLHRIAMLVAKRVEERRESDERLRAAERDLSETRKAQRNILASIEQGIIPPGAKERIAELSRAEEDAMRRIDALTADTNEFDVAAFEEWLKGVAERGSDELVVGAFASRVVLYDGYGIVVMKFQVRAQKEPVESTFALNGFEQFQNGSPGRIRTYNPPVNSRMLCR